MAKIGRTRDDGNIHHLDEDQTNDTPENLAIGHHSCHAEHHGAERRAETSARVKQEWADGIRVFVPQSEEVRRRQAESLTGRTIPQDVRERISATLTGMRKTDSHRDAIKRAWARRREQSALKQQGEI